MSGKLLQQVLDYTAGAPREMDVRGVLGAALMADWRAGLAARGFVWHTDVGAFSTPIVGGGNGTVFDQDQPELVIDVPAGWALLPLSINVACQTPLIAADSDETEILIAADVAAKVGATASNGTVESPTNSRSNILGGCPLSVVSACTVNTTNPTLGYEIAHAVRVGDVQGIVANALWGELSLLYQPVTPPLIIGPAALLVYFGGTVATSGFINADFAAIPANLVSGLS